ncbi:hypothetical protein L1987_43176 [Smallanthus sonchifolius]|uniref:Uncharacterized protein n=1 Tax=Smallanthus sonchifolius TaxID=185202 RepID=A0ACB9GKX5_9ASTR|nr:hypothetical protein L1987_43176 [Smallanthus sonchifolius]
MDFVTNLPRTSDTIWVIVSRLVKSAHSLSIKVTDKSKKRARQNIKKIEARHGLAIVANLTIDNGDRLKYGLELALQSTSLSCHEELRNIHDTFHVANLKVCLSDETLIIPSGEIHIGDKAHPV